MADQKIPLQLISRFDDPCRQPHALKANAEPALVGGGSDDLLCSHCGFEIAEAVEACRLKGLQLRCPKCGCENEVRP
jgi:predicted RNA-binding Zn-ribbon protein involved in translation (DUF1610 family)